jgi:hypothetical protein
MVDLNSFPEVGMQAITHPLQSLSLWELPGLVNDVEWKKSFLTLFA